MKSRSGDRDAEWDDEDLKEKIVFVGFLAVYTLTALTVAIRIGTKIIILRKTIRALHYYAISMILMLIISR